jgi:Fe-S cluster assembly iron-binding protein IscA
MLQITDTAASAFRDILERKDVPGTAIRLVPEMTDEDQGNIALQAIEQPAPSDSHAQAEGVEVVVAPELADKLDDAILDAKVTAQGPEFFIRRQDEAPA